VTPTAELELDVVSLRSYCASQANDDSSITTSLAFDAGQHQFIEDLLVDKINMKREIKNLHERLCETLKGTPKTVLGGQFKLPNTPTNAMLASPNNAMRMSMGNERKDDEGLRAAFKQRDKMCKELSRDLDFARAEIEDGKRNYCELNKANDDLQIELDQVQSHADALRGEFDKMELQAEGKEKANRDLRSECQELIAKMDKLTKDHSNINVRHDKLLVKEQEEAARKLSEIEEEKRKIIAQSLRESNESKMLQNNMRTTFCERLSAFLSIPHSTNRLLNSSFHLWRLMAIAGRSIRAFEREKELRVKADKNIGMLEQVLQSEQKRNENMARAAKERAASSDRQTEEETAQKMKKLICMLEQRWQEKESNDTAAWTKQISDAKVAHENDISALKKAKAEKHVADKEKNKLMAEMKKSAADLQHSTMELGHKQILHEGVINTMKLEHRGLTEKLEEATELANKYKEEIKEMESEMDTLRLRYDNLAQHSSGLEEKDKWIRREKVLLKEVRQLREELGTAQSLAAHTLSPSSPMTHDDEKRRARNEKMHRQ